MKNILLSVGVIGVVAAAAIGATSAFFFDTETSSGNVIVAGSIDLNVDSLGASYNGQDLPNSTWTARDLTDQIFFDFSDIKPNDEGRRHISLHVDDNPAWACITFVGTNLENDLNDAEADAGDVTPGVEEGELSQNIALFAWQDNDSDAQYNPGSGEIPLYESFFDVFTKIHVADVHTGSPLVPTGPQATRQVTLAWCAGTQTVNHTTGEITCDGSGMSDEAQSDEFPHRVVLYATQERNNPEFQCELLELSLVGGPYQLP